MGDYQKYLNKVLRFLSYRARSEKEVIEFLQKKQTPQEIKEQILLFLKEKRFVNDEEFTRWWIDSRLRVHRKSKRVIEMELKQKGIAQDIIVQAISGFNDEENGGVSDIDTANKLVTKKIERYRALPKQEIYKKLGGFLARKGFDWETIKKSIDSELGRD